MVCSKATIKCFGILGCFSIDGHFRSSSRPVNIFPQPVSVINTTFLLYTRKNPYEPKLIRLESTRHVVDFSSNRQTKVIIHGYQEDGFTKLWIKDLVNTLLKKDDFNVFVVDWGNGARMVYPQAVANARLVGAILANLIRRLQMSHGAFVESFHLIGHSLGAHIAGYVGEIVGNLGRITGLDPAKPYFEGTHPSVRLDPSDAHFVDVIHTDGRPFIQGGLGMLSSCGHVDFYPNGGQKQPGCGGPIMSEIFDRETFVSGLRQWLTCQHKRAHQYFTESVHSPCRFVSVRCSDFESFVQGKCFDCGQVGENCASMGFYADETFTIGKSNKPSKFYLLTSNSSPYCQIQRRITEAKYKNSSTRVQNLNIKLRDINWKELNELKLKPNTYTLIGTSFQENISYVEVKEQYLLNPFAYFFKEESWKVCLPNIIIETLGVDKEISTCKTTIRSCKLQVYKEDIKCNDNNFKFDFVSNSLVFD